MSQSETFCKFVVLQSCWALWIEKKNQSGEVSRDVRVSGSWSIRLLHPTAPNWAKKKGCDATDAPCKRDGSEHLHIHRSNAHPKQLAVPLLLSALMETWWCEWGEPSWQRLTAPPNLPMLGRFRHKDWRSKCPRERGEGLVVSWEISWCSWRCLPPHPVFPISKYPLWKKANCRYCTIIWLAGVQFWVAGEC